MRIDPEPLHGEAIGPRREDFDVAASEAEEGLR